MDLSILEPALTLGCRECQRLVLGGWQSKAQPWLGPTRWLLSAFPPNRDTHCLPAHRVLLVEQGINIIEALELDCLATAGVYEFAFVLSHLNIYGATGAPVRPLAIA